jgi:hypothetical protein
MSGGRFFYGKSSVFTHFDLSPFRRIENWTIQSAKRNYVDVRSFHLLHINVIGIHGFRESEKEDATALRGFFG